MAIDRTPILKRCRALGISPSYLGIDKSSKRQPVHSNRKASQYGLQLREKQKAKFIYGVLEKQFRRYYEKAARVKGRTGEELKRTLELRLDNILFRLNWARTRQEARQMVSHRFVTVNGKVVNIPSYIVNKDDVIEVRENKSTSQRLKDIVDVTSGRLVPTWLESDLENFRGKVVELPSDEYLDEIPFDATLVVELYSK